MNPAAFETDAAGYRQQFDRRGHPVNEDTARENRRLRRAQNEVLQVVGVVRSRYAKKRQLSRHHDLSDDELVDMVRDENLAGTIIRIVNPMVMDLSVWWLTAFRTRLVSFRSYLQPGLMHALRSERRVLGNTGFFLSGLAYNMLADEIREYRSWLIPPSSREIVSSFDPFWGSSAPTWTYRLLQRLKDFGLFAIEWPLRSRGTLQALGLIPFHESVSWCYLLPVLSTSPFISGDGPVDLSPSAQLVLLAAFVRSPLVASYILEQIREGIELCIYALLRSVVPRPDNPDQLSQDGRAEELENMIRSVSRFGVDIFGEHFVDSQWTWLSKLLAVFPTMPKLHEWCKLQFTQRRVRLDPAQRCDLLQASRLRYSELVRSNQRLPHAERMTDEVLRREAISQAFAEALIDPRGSLVNIHQWADEISSGDDASTATPPPEDLFSPDQLLDNIDSNDANSAAQEPPPPRSSFSPTGPLETLLEPTDLREVDIPPTASPPEPGISRVASLTQISNQPSSAPRPVRRPTELDDISHIASSIRSAAPAPQRPASSAPSPVIESEPSSHRVTLLSAFPADTLVRYSSTFLTSIILLPLDVYYTRRLAMAFLKSSPKNTASLGILSQDIGPLRPTTDIFSMSTLQLTQKVLLTFAIEALLKGSLWRSASKLCIYIGRRWFLWGVA